MQYGTLFDERVLCRLSAIEGAVLDDLDKRIDTLAGVQKVATKHPIGEAWWILERPPSGHLDLVHDGKALPEGSRGKPSLGWEGSEYYEFCEVTDNEVVLSECEVYVTAWIEFLPKSSDRWKCRLLKVSQYELHEEFEPVGDKSEPLIDFDISDLFSIHVDQYDTGGVPLIRRDLARHLLRKDTPGEQIFAVGGKRSAREVLLALEAQCTFQYLVPKLATLHATQILEVREKVKDTREGFTMHLRELSYGLLDRLRDSAELADIKYFADNLINNKLIPTFKEFERQVKAEAATRRGIILDAANDVITIEVPTLPVRYDPLGFLSFGGMAPSSGSERMGELSNQRQAFRFMQSVRREAVNF